MTGELSADEARTLTDEVKADTHALWLKLEQLYEGRAHKALGFESWGAYCATEFDLSFTRAYALLDAGRVAQILGRSPMEEPPATERVARELAPLRDEPQAMQEAWHEAVERHGPQPTAEQVREIVRGPGNDLRFARIENAADSLNTLPAQIAWPIEDGDVEAMDNAFRSVREFYRRRWPQWKAHKAALRAARKAAKHLRAVA